MKHTPGPYYVGEYAHPNGRPYGVERGIFTSHGQIKLAVCEQWEGEKESQEAEANAHLFSAAPELLQALQDLLRVAIETHEFEPSEPVCINARTAIAKAEAK